ncbi:hypothetical protein HT136_05665 [Novosphingobium profundi]|uniref:hypothetical protein n=1 Tax=Novosphingobium profundi TaxID=1774954 RepID=UPI001BDAFBE1|nr:hypothetical protein [Novosphingobium profundi]MBT0667852.1 hypothetical protein [Novosphingobium profundi]
MIVNLLLMIVLCTVVCELFLRLPIAQACTRLTGVGRSASRVLLSRRISDHWKERVMPVLALRMGAGTAVLAGWFLIVLAAITAICAGADLISPGFSTLLTSALGIALSCGVSVGYLLVRQAVKRVTG